MNPKPSFLARNAWLLVVLAFVLLLGAWSALITIAVKHTPETIPITESSGH